MGLHAFVLDYRVAPYTISGALLDVQRAIRYLRYYEDTLLVAADKIALMGFSAGGHLSLMAAEQFDEGQPNATDPINRVSCRPDAQILCYLGITFHTFEKAFLETVLGKNYTQEDVFQTMLHKNIRPDMSPTFFWGTQGDFLFDQWLLFLNAINEKEHQIPISFHIFPNGEHSYGRLPAHALWHQWSSLCKSWLQEIGFVI